MTVDKVTVAVSEGTNMNGVVRKESSKTAAQNGQRDKMKNFWDLYNGQPTIQSMMLNSDASSIHDDDLSDITSVLPDLTGKRVLELGAGIGRFTGVMAQTAADVLTTDFIESFIDKNREAHSHLPNVRYEVADAMGVHLDEESIDFVFTNWLLMYLNHEETAEFLRRCLTWLTPGSQMHIRESCSEPSSKHKKKTNENPTYYRHISQYIQLLRHLRIPTKTGGRGGQYMFQVEWAKSVPTYVVKNQNWRQVHLMITKVPVDPSTELETAVGFPTRWRQDLLDLQYAQSKAAVRAAVAQQAKAAEKILNVDVAILDPFVLSQVIIHQNLAHLFQTDLPESVIFSLNTDEFKYSTQLSYANRVRNQNLRFQFVTDTESDVTKWKLPLGQFDAVLGLFHANSSLKYLQNLQDLVSNGGNGGRILLLTSTEEDLDSFKKKASVLKWTNVDVENLNNNENQQGSTCHLVSVKME